MGYENGVVLLRAKVLSTDWQKLCLTAPHFRVRTLQYFSDKLFHFLLYARYWTFWFPQMHRFSLPPEKSPPSQDKGPSYIFCVSVRLTCVEDCTSSGNVWLFYIYRPGSRVPYALRLCLTLTDPVEEKTLSHQSKHNLHSPSGELATCFRLINPSLGPYKIQTN